MEFIGKYFGSWEIESAVDNGDLRKPYVALDTLTGEIDYNSYDSPYAKFFTLEAETSGSLTISGDSSNFEYSYDGFSWDSLTGSPASISFAMGEVVYLRGYYSTLEGIVFLGYGSFKISGNIMSLIDGDNFPAIKELSTPRLFKNLFLGCTGITDASELVLPALTLSEGCYESMFEGCSSLVNAPSLPATTLVTDCYKRMYYGCSSIENIGSNASSMMGPTPGAGYTDNWVYGVAAMGMFRCDLYSTWGDGVDGCPTGWIKVGYES